MAASSHSAHAPELETEEDVKEVIYVGSDNEEEGDRIGKSVDPEIDPPYLTGNPRFDVVMRSGNIFLPGQLGIPKRICKLLPRARTPAALKFENRTWDVYYCGDHIYPRFDSLNWKAFVKDNEIKIGDACVFELMENNGERIEFKVRILKCNIPPELAAFLNSQEGAEEDSVKID